MCYEWSHNHAYYFSLPPYHLCTRFLSVMQTQINLRFQRVRNSAIGAVSLLKGDLDKIQGPGSFSLDPFAIKQRYKAALRCAVISIRSFLYYADVEYRSERYDFHQKVWGVICRLSPMSASTVTLQIPWEAVCRDVRNIANVIDGRMVRKIMDAVQSEDVIVRRDEAAQKWLYDVCTGQSLLEERQCRDRVNAFGSLLLNQIDDSMAFYDDFKKSCEAVGLEHAQLALSDYSSTEAFLGHVDQMIACISPDAAQRVLSADASQLYSGLVEERGRYDTIKLYYERIVQLAFPNEVLPEDEDENMSNATSDLHEASAYDVDLEPDSDGDSYDFGASNNGDDDDESDDDDDDESWSGLLL